MSATRGKRGLGRAAGRVAAVLLAIGAMAALTLPGTSRGAPLAGLRDTVDVPLPVSSDTILRALGIDPNPPAELVFLVDTSDSMQTEGLYPKVTQQLSDYFQTLAQQAQDQVVVITVGQGAANQVVYGPGTPPLAAPLPPVAHGGTTDFGAAFSLALTQLSSPPAGIKVGGVVLLSDGGMSAPHDPLYDGGQGYSAPGWAQLRTRAQGLPIPVTGYQVALTTNQKYIDDQHTALSKVFSPVRQLPSGTTNLAGPLGVATQEVVSDAVINRTSPDSNQGFAVSWSGLPGDGKSLNLRSAGHLTVKISLTALTSKVPLYVTDLHLDAPGLPIKLSGSPPPIENIPANSHKSFYATFTWQPQTIGSSLSGGTAKAPGHLVLTGMVGSTWTQTLGTAFKYTNFKPGVLSGATSAFEATETRASYLQYFRIPLYVLIGLILIVLLSMLRSGSLVLSAVGHRSGRVLLLPVFPVLLFPTRRKTGISGLLTVRGAPFGRGMTISLRRVGQPAGKVRLPPGERLTIVAGVEVVYRPLFGRR